MPAFKIEEARTGPIPQDDYFTCPLIRVGDHWAALLGHKDYLDDGFVILGRVENAGSEFFDQFTVEIKPGESKAVAPGFYRRATRDPLAVAISRAWSKAANEGPTAWPNGTEINLKDFEHG